MISKRMKYAIKALLFLAKSSSREHCIRIGEISEKERIPKKFLEQILLELKKARYVGSIQGKDGGYYILKNPSDISLAQIYRLYEGPIALIQCASENFYEPCIDCVDESNCKIKLAIQRVRLQTLQVMESIDLQQMM